MMEVQIVDAKVQYVRVEGLPAFDHQATGEMIQAFMEPMHTYSLAKLMVRAHWKDHSLHLATETWEGEKLSESLLPHLTKIIGRLISHYKLVDIRITIPKEQKVNRSLN